MLTVLYVAFFISALSMIAVVLLQSGRSAGLGAIAGGAQSLFGKKKGLDDLLAKATVVIAVVFMVLAIALTSLST